jgi:hypothetical protein
VKKTLLFFCAAMVMASCGGTEDPHGTTAAHPPAPEMAEEIGRLETLLQDSTGSRRIAAELMRSYQDFYNFYPNDQRAAGYLFKAADLARGLKKPKVCIDLLTTLHDAFPDDPKADQVAFLVAFEYEQGLRDTTMARTYYRKVIELHPASMWAQEAEKNLKLLEMTKEEMIKFLQSQNSPS